MTTEVCPYCRGPIGTEEPAMVCDGCGTRHHADCYSENGGCTIFGCSCAPADEGKLTVSTVELIHESAPAPPALCGAAAPAPPPPPGRRPRPLSVAELRQISNRVVPSMFGSFSEEDVSDAPEPLPDDQPKSRTTYMVLGALLGAFGAHNFYAGYNKKAGAQLAITVLTLGFGSPMSWIWAIIDICTIDRDSQGVQLES
jgi:TM2 domain-containing membrane protein YozV